MTDEIRRPGHYDGMTVDCMTAMGSMLNAQPEHTPEGRVVTGAALYWLGSVLKYTWRAFRKNGLNDLLKARQCLDYLIGEAYGRDGLEAIGGAQE